jgi:hypothetical protein
MTESKSGTCHPEGMPGPNSEFLEDRCTNRVEPYTIGKGSKSSARQCYTRHVCDHPSLGDQIVHIDTWDSDH